MCFKTAGLAPVAKKAGGKPEPVVKTITTSAGAAVVQYAKSGTREVVVKFGHKVPRAFKAGSSDTGENAQYLTADDLRELASEFRKLAKKLEA